MDEEGAIHAVERKDFTLVALIGIKDIIREEVPDAVKACQKAGITVRMVTGDNKNTALAIAKECNIIPKQGSVHKYAVLEGRDFFEMVGGLKCKACNEKSPCSCPISKVDEAVVNDKAFDKIRPHLKVLARSRPEDKYLLVTGLKQF